ncbi:MAG TPA: ABATE domain-containing protein [Solirubrobacteraceae bacterium]|nr:ABATE domain-containing protein [Solirubrobacteraceae bacterium]
MQRARDLPETLALPLAGGAEWWYWLGGRPALDFVNTLRERWRRRVETLVTPEDLGLWLVRAELVDELPRVSVALLGEARELREAIDRCVTARLDGGRAPAAVVDQIDRWLPEAPPRPRLSAETDGGLIFDERPALDPARQAVAAIALDAARMLGTPDQASRVRICASDTCSSRFYDRSPAGRRRWCSMEVCGNQAKARRHRARLSAA